VRPGGARELPLARADDVGELEEVLGVLAAAFLDETLEQMLVAFAVKEPKVRQLFSGLSFKARTDLAYALGLIGDIERNDLDVIRGVRNQFAHKVRGLSFDRQSIASRCRQLRSLSEISFRVPSDTAEPMRFRFVTAVVVIASTLRARLARLRHREKPEPLRDIEVRLRGGPPHRPA